MDREKLEEKPYIDAFDYIEYLGEKIEDRTLIKINRFLQEDRKKKNKEIERLKNIIKEVRELVNKTLNINSDYVDYEFGVELLRQELLEILDKGSDEISK